MSLSCICDICGVKLKQDYGMPVVGRPEPFKPVGVGSNKYYSEKVYNTATLYSEDYLRKLNLLEVDLCQKCLDRCFDVIIEETKQITQLSYQRRDKLNTFLAANLRQFNGMTLKDGQGRNRK